MTKRFVAYYRVSTARQGRSGLGLDAQRKAVHDYLNGGSWELIEELTEVESGKRSVNRPELAKALSLCELTGATLVIAKLDRLSRNAAFLMNLSDSGVDFVAVDMPNANTLTVGIMALVAQDEAERISQRTKAALAAAKARGVKLGGDRGNLGSVRAAGTANSAKRRREAAQARARLVAPHIAEARAAGHLSTRAIAGFLNGKGIRTVRGAEWQGSSVARVVAAAN